MRIFKYWLILYPIASNKKNNKNSANKCKVEKNWNIFAFAALKYGKTIIEICKKFSKRNTHNSDQGTNVSRFLLPSHPCFCKVSRRSCLGQIFVVIQCRTTKSSRTEVGPSIIKDFESIKHFSSSMNVQRYSQTYLVGVVWIDVSVPFRSFLKGHALRITTIMWIQVGLNK